MAHFDHFSAGRSTRVGARLTARAIEFQLRLLARRRPGGNPLIPGPEPMDWKEAG